MMIFVIVVNQTVQRNIVIVIEEVRFVDRGVIAQIVIIAKITIKVVIIRIHKVIYKCNQKRR